MKNHYTSNQPIVAINASQNDFEILLISAFRYSLGRSSYVPSVIIDIIENNKEQIRESTLGLFIREIELRKQLGPDSLGMSIENELWLDLQERLLEYIDNKECEK